MSALGEARHLESRMQGGSIRVPLRHPSLKLRVGRPGGAPRGKGLHDTKRGRHLELRLMELLLLDPLGGEVHRSRFRGTRSRGVLELM